ncbi:conserved unknown protein [Ectocarpus siliculosus]|uniref:Gelation factor n=1 Tax=Ectocarpus siliculosus TaxID=2880 RepID=D7FHD6_ECTSI|nr:conserved unknown protein [Ectocarpus siliculosus]|eukprot:CBJ28503.1 conserved unknown protein [Ectocarpus siliculosus]
MRRGDMARLSSMMNTLFISFIAMIVIHVDVAMAGVSSVGGHSTPAIDVLVDNNGVRFPTPSFAQLAGGDEDDIASWQGTESPSAHWRKKVGKFFRPILRVPQVFSSPTPSPQECTRVELSGNLSRAVSDVPSQFTVQVKDSSGGNSSGSSWWPWKKASIEVDLRMLGSTHNRSLRRVFVATPVDLGKGQFLVEYFTIQPGTYEWSVKDSAGEHVCDIHGTSCSPFQMEVVADRSVGAHSVAEGIAPFSLNGVFQAVAGSSQSFRVQARDKNHFDRREGGDNLTTFLVPVEPAAWEESQRHEGYVGTVIDNEDGTYDVSYNAELHGTYTLQARIGGERVSHCNASVVPTGAAAYPACVFEDPVLTVVHGELDGTKCTVMGFPDKTRPTVHSAGTAKNFSIVSKDSVGNTRTGPSLGEHGDDRSDVFVVTLSDDHGHVVRTTSAVQTITAANATEGSFRLEFGGATSRQLSTSASASEVQATLMEILGDEIVNVTVSNSRVRSGSVAWRATFLSHLEEWSESPLRVAPAEDGRTIVSVDHESSNGVYPIQYTLRIPGRYDMRITDVAGQVIDGGSRVVQATSMRTKASLSTATGTGLHGGIAGKRLRVVVQARVIADQPEVQALSGWTAGNGSNGNGTCVGDLPLTFELAYGGERTLPIPFEASAGEVAEALKALRTPTATVSRSNGDELSPLWLVTFNGDTNSKCFNGPGGEAERAHPCPTFEGDHKPLLGSTSGELTCLSGRDRPSRGIRVAGIVKGTPAVNQVDSRDLATLRFSLFANNGHAYTPPSDNIDPVIAMHEKQELTCTVNEPTGTMSSNFGFRLDMFRRDAFVEARGTLQDLRNHLEKMLASAHQKHVRVQVTSAFGQRSLCGPRGNKVMIEFSRTNGAPPELKISEYVGVSHVSIRQVTKAVDSVSYVGQGRYVIEYTPVLAGNFSAEVLVAGAMIPPSGSMGDVTVLPSFEGLRGKLQVDESGVAGVQHRVTATPSDEYGNVIDPSNLPPGQGLAIRVRGFPDPRADVDLESKPFLVDLEMEIDGPDLNGNARFVGSFTPIAAGWYVVQSAFVGPDGPSKALLDFTERVGQPGHLGAPGMVRTHQFFDDDVQLAGVFVLPGEVSATQSSIAGRGLHECLIGTEGLNECAFTITSRDAFGNKRFRTRSDEWHVTANGIAKHGGLPSSDADAQVVSDSLNGSYTVTYVPPSEGDYQIVVTLGNSSATSAIAHVHGPPKQAVGLAALPFRLAWEHGTAIIAATRWVVDRAARGGAAIIAAARWIVDKAARGGAAIIAAARWVFDMAARVDAAIIAAARWVVPRVARGGAAIIVAARPIVYRATTALLAPGRVEHLRLFLRFLPAIPAVAWASHAVANWKESLVLLSRLWSCLRFVLDPQFGVVVRAIHPVARVVFAVGFVAVLAIVLVFLVHRACWGLVVYVADRQERAARSHGAPASGLRRTPRHVSTPDRDWLTSVESAVIHLLCGVPRLRDELLDFEHQDVYKSWWATIKSWFIAPRQRLERNFVLQLAAIARGLWYDEISPAKTDLQQDPEPFDKDPSGIYVRIVQLTNSVRRLLGLSRIFRTPVPLVRDQHHMVLQVFLQALENVLPLETMAFVDFWEVRAYYEDNLVLVELDEAPDLLFVLLDEQAKRDRKKRTERLQVMLFDTDDIVNYTPAAVLNGSIDGDTVVSRVDLDDDLWYRCTGGNVASKLVQLGAATGTTKDGIPVVPWLEAADKPTAMVFRKKTPKKAI